ncbi:MAG: hypothetical protein DRH07_03700 [Deltaproteobacteria bacterium]|nr:MAG: hypothetical protein DRH07_03700 [Deltaproteobacteria bacterium]
MKSKSLKILTLLLASLLLLLTGVVADVFAQKNLADSKTVQPAEISTLQTEGAHFIYTPKGRRDPFKPLVQKKQKIAKKSQGRAEKFKGPLERIELSKYRLIALMVVKGIPRAMVKAPDGKSYTVKVGEYIGLNDGVVKRIETKVVATDENGLRVEKSPDRIVVEEVGYDSYTGQEVKEYRYIAM